MSVRILIGDCRETLAGLEAGSVQTCVTSPPYFGLRDYGHAGQIGLEATPDAFVAELVSVFQEVRRVLRDDGTLWLNLGDSYANDAKWGGSTGGKHVTSLHGAGGMGREKRTTGLKSKDLIGIPWRVAFALQADGWYLRSDIIWHKPNPMPESVTDRPTKAHEYLFLLTKAERYYYDAAAIAEPAERGAAGSEFHTGKTGEHQLGRASTKPRESVPRGGFNGKTNAMPGREAFRAVTETRNRRTVWTVATQPFKGAHFATFPPALIEPCILAGSLPVGALEPIDYIDTPTGERAGDDPTMQTGRAGMNRPRGEAEGRRRMSRHEHEQYAAQLRNSPHGEAMERAAGATAFAHYLRTDASGARPIPPSLLDAWIGAGWLSVATPPSPRTVDASRCTVLDPFGGAGTTGLVADRLGRDAVLCELNPTYADMARARIADDSPLFSDVEAA